MIALHCRALPCPFSLCLTMKHQWPGLIEPCRHVGLHRRNIRACNIPSIPRRRSETWPSQIRFCTPICQTCWQPPAMPSGHCETICQWVWLSAWWMEEGWMRMQRTLASLRIHPLSEYIRQMILMMNHPNSMLLSALAGVCSVLTFGGASRCNGAENVAENATILWPVAPSWQKVQRKMQCNGQKKRYARSLFYNNISLEKAQ